MSLFESGLLRKVLRSVPRYYRSVRELEKLSRKQRMDVNSLMGFLAARQVPAAEREIFSLAYRQNDAPQGAVPVEELKDYLERTLNEAAREVRAQITSAPTVTHPRSTNKPSRFFPDDYVPLADVRVVLSHPNVPEETRNRLWDFFFTRHMRRVPEQLSFFHRLRGGRADRSPPAPEISEFNDLIFRNFLAIRPYVAVAPAHNTYAEYTLPGLMNYFHTHYDLGPRPYNTLLNRFGEPNTEQHFGRETLYHTRGGTATVTDAASFGPVLHIAELQSDAGADMRKRTPRIARSRKLRSGENLPLIDDIVEEALKPDYRQAMSVFGVNYNPSDLSASPDLYSEDVVRFVFGPNEFRHSLRGRKNLDPNEAKEQRDRFLARVQELDPGYERLTPWYETEVAHHQPWRYPLVGDTAEWTRHALRNRLAHALEGDFVGMSTGSADTILPYVGGNPEGQRAYYDGLVPRLLESIAKEYDPQARVVETLIKTPDDQPWWTESPHPPASERRAYYLRFTPELRRAVAERGIPYFGLLPFLMGEPVDDMGSP